LCGDIDGLKEIAAIDAPSIGAGFYIMVRIYPRADFQYPVYANKITTFSRKNKELTVSIRVEIEEIAGKFRDQIYNLVLDRIIETLPVFAAKKIKDVPLDVVENALLTLRYAD